jgi:chemotaxis protein methyltransferase CheR
MQLSRPYMSAREQNTTKSRALAEPQSALPPGLFVKYQSLIYREAGIWLGTHKEALLSGRLAKRLRLLGIESMAEYYKLVTHPDQQHERSVLIDCITTNETHFFRESRHFDFLVSDVIPKLQQQASSGTRSKQIRVWSAGCSSGEEPYSLAMMLQSFLPAEDGWDVEILGTDISTRVLERAREGLYPIAKSQEIPTKYLREFMLRGQGESAALMKVDAKLQKHVRFARLNLHADHYPISGEFDLIFCRNVLIYFDQSSKEKVVAGLLRHLSPAGLLFVGHAENLNGMAHDLKSIVPTIYTRASNVVPDKKSRAHE